MRGHSIGRSSRRAARAIVALLLLIPALLAWLLLREPPSRRAAPAVDDPTPRDATSHDLGHDDPTRTGDGDAVSSAPSVEVPDPARESVVADFVETIGPTIVVLERETGRPLPDAGVWWLARDEVEAARWRELQRGDAATLEALEHDGHAVELDALAGAELPWRASLARLWVRDGDREALRTIALDERAHHRIALARAEALTLRAVDGDGRPVRDVPVALAACPVVDGNLTPQREEPLHLVDAVTDRDGEVRCERGSRWLDEHVDGDGLATRQALIAALAFPCRDRRTTAIDPRDGCKAPIELRPPLLADLRLRAALANDAPRLVPVIVQIACAEPIAGPLPSFVAQRALPAGEAIEQVIEAAGRFRIEAESDDGKLVSDPIVVTAGAVATTTELLIRLKPRPPPPLGTIVVLDPGNRPLATTEVAWQPADKVDFPKPAAMLLGTTDPRGRLAVKLESLPRPLPGESSALQLYAGLIDGGDGGARLRGQLVLVKSSYADGEMLGQVVMAEVPRIVAGRVVSGSGAGLRDVALSIVDRDRAWMDHGRLALVEQSLGLRVHWNTRSGEEGRFEVHSRPTCTDVVIRAELRGWHHVATVEEARLQPHDEASVGADQATVVMRRNGRARGRLLVEPGVSIARLALRSDPDDPDGAPLLRAELADDGRFEVEGIPGRFTLQVVSRTDPAVAGQSWTRAAHVLAEVADLAWVEDQFIVDPRLDPIDLRGALETIEVVARTPEGEPIAGARLFLVGSRDDVIELAPTADPFGRAVVSVPIGTPRLVVGTRDRLVQWTRFDRPQWELVLPPAPRVRLVLPGADHPLRGMPAVLELRQADFGDATNDVARSLGPFECRRVGDDDSREMLLESGVPFLGTWYARFLTSPSDRSALWSVRVEVRANDPIVEVRVELTAAQVEQIEQRRGPLPSRR